MTTPLASICARFVVLALGLLAPPLYGQSDGQYAAVSSFEKESTLAADSLRLVYQLPDSFLVPDSEFIRIDSTRLSASEYSLDYLSGSLLFEKPVTSSQISIRYKIFPFSLKREYFKRQRVAAVSEKGEENTNGAGSEIQPKPNPVTQSFASSNLRKSGSIIRGLTVGSNQGLAVDSGLRMQLAGNLTEDIEVIASLTDQNTPIQPEGNTQTLQEIDKVFVQLKAPGFQGTLGDYNLTFSGTEFTNYNRKLQGVKGRGDFRDHSVTLSGAVSRGQFATNEFQGQEGNQGPYQLRGPDGQINIIVLAGTERVWIDGQAMRRGENNDYVIEYGNGQITFTRNRLITSDSRIVVDFQFSDESFQRNFWSAQGESRFLGDRVNLTTTFIRESDDKDNPLRFALSEESLSVLEAAGDSLAVIPGDTLVGDGNGAYVKDSTGVFVFVGPGLGNFNVTFSFFGDNRGDYRNIGLGRFEFVGENQGAYRPFIILPKAQRHDVVGLNLGFRPAPFLEIGGEAAFSQLDGNLYSQRNDANNSGSAYHLKFKLQPERFKFGTVNVSAALRNKSVDYRDIDRSTIAEFDRRWDIPNSIVTQQERIGEVQGSYQPFEGMALRGGFGHLSKSSLFSSTRWEAATTLDREHLPRLDYFVEWIDRNSSQEDATSTWLRQRGNASYQFKFLQPIFEYEGEIKKESASDSSGFGFRFDSYTAGLILTPWQPLTVSARYNIRDDKRRLAGVFQPESIARTQSYGLTLRRWHAFSIAANYTHREREFTDVTVQDTRTDLADIRLGFAPGNRSLRSNLYYQISTKRQALQEEVFIEVEEGEGNFRFNEELQEFEPDPFGNFVRRLLATNNFVPVVELRMRADVRLDPHKMLGMEFLNPLTTETFLRIDERTREQDVTKIYLLNLDHFQRDSTTIFGNIELRQDVHLWEKSRKRSVRYRFRTRRELNNQFIAGGQKRNVVEHRLRNIYQFNDHVGGELELTYGREDRIFQSAAREDRKVRSNKIDLDMVYRPQRQLELGLKSLFSFNRDIVPTPNTEAKLISFTPRTTYSLSQKGRLRAEIEWTNVEVAPENRLIPFELTDGRRAGTTFRWTLGFDYRVSRNVQASLNYFGRSEPDRPNTQHIAKMEMRAFF